MAVGAMDCKESSDNGLGHESDNDPQLKSLKSACATDGSAVGRVHCDFEVLSLFAMVSKGTNEVCDASRLRCEGVRNYRTEAPAR